MTPPAPVSQPAFRVSDVRGWTLHEYNEVDSTNYVARRLPAWHAVRADTQTAGRGRFQRTWVSDAGGLWLSAIVPAAERKESFLVLPLVAGLAAIEALKEFSVAGLRLRWPNDIMVGNRKLAGLLLDTFNPQLAVIGLGVNVMNQPARQDATLETTATRLADLVQTLPAMSELTSAILDSLRAKVTMLANEGFSALHTSINELWGGQPKVTVVLDNGKREGVFVGVDSSGRLLLRESASQVITLDTHEVKLLREL